MTTDARPRVLIVEDEPDMNNLLADVLSAYGFEPLQATSGEQGLSLLSEHRPDAILLDLMLPGLSGFELCRLLKTSRATRPIPILILTALDRHLDRRYGFESGADDYLTKPFEPDALVARLRACLAECRAVADARCPLASVLEPSGALSDLKTFNALATCLYDRTDLAPEQVEALRKGLVRLSETAGKWATAHGGLLPVRLTVDLNAERLRLVFLPSADGGDGFLAEHLDAEAAVPAAFTDAGVIDRILPEGHGVVLEKALAPRAHEGPPG